MPWISLIPPFITIILTFKTKKLIPSLFVGVAAGAVIMSYSVPNGIISIGEYIVDGVANKESIYTLGFLIAFGSLAELIEMAGGISGFSEKVGKWIKNERGVLIWTWILSIITFFDSSFHIIAVGTILNPLLQKVKGSKEKFAFILSVTSLQLIELIPVATGFLGYMVTLVSNNIKDKYEANNAYSIFLKSILWNFMPWSMLLIAFLVTLLGLGFGNIRIGRVKYEQEFTQKHIEKQKCLNLKLEEYPRKSINLIIPVATLLTSTVFLFWWTGKDRSQGFLGAISNARYNVSIFSAALFTLLVTGIFFMFQKISLAEIESHIIGGGEKVLSLVIVLVLSWALTVETKNLGFNNLINENTAAGIPKFLMPSLTFLLSGLISYTVGSSWAAWALLMPLAVAFSSSSGIDISMMIGTVWSGGAVSDVISPLSAKISDIPFGDHLSTAFPYLLLGTALSFVGYLIAGLTLLS